MDGQPTTGRIRQMTLRRWAQLGLVVVGALLVFVAHLGVLKVVVALVACYVMFRVGFTVIGSFARPVPPPPPPGELRRVRMQFRCSLCGTEVRMTFANDEIPEPPRHCMEDMELVAPVTE